MPALGGPLALVALGVLVQAPAARYGDAQSGFEQEAAVLHPSACSFQFSGSPPGIGASPV